MAIADVIKQYRNRNDMTQEEMARYLGVTASAVNKWEKGNTLPDVALLAPIARLLGITTDELLGFREDLTAEEVNQFMLQIQQELKDREFSEVFAAVKKKIEEYPNCEILILHASMMLHAHQLFHGKEEQKYDPVIYSWLERCLDSEDEQVKKKAAEALFYAFFNKDDFVKASSYLSYFSFDDPERKRKEALLSSKNGKREDAYRIYEELILNGYQSFQQNLNSLRILYMEDEDHEMVKKLVGVSTQAAKAFEMGRYHEVSVGFDAAAWEKDVERTIQIMKDILEHAYTVGDFTKSALYQHMGLRELPEDISGQIVTNIWEILDDEKFDYMNGNKDWEEMRKSIEK